MAYAYMTHGRTRQQVIEVDRILAGPEGESPAAIAARNAEAMKMLGQVGMVAPKRSRKS